MATQLSVLLAASLLAWSGEEASRPTVEEAARDFRIHSYDHFRQQRPEYDRRVKASAELEKRWKQFEEYKLTPDDPDAFVKWYEDALQLSTNDSLPPLPAGPEVPPPPRKEISVSAPALEVPNFLVPQPVDLPVDETQPALQTPSILDAESAMPELDITPNKLRPMDVIGAAPIDRTFQKKPASNR